jgi:hypothetical protein
MGESFAGGLIDYLCAIGDDAASRMCPQAQTEWADFREVFLLLSEDISRKAPLSKEESLPAARANVPRGTYREFLAMQLAQNGNGPMSASEVMAQFVVPKRTAYHWLAKARDEATAHKLRGRV